MELNPVATELTTAATDLVIAVLASGAAVHLLRAGAEEPFRARLWAAVLGCLAGAALLGTIVHGLALAEGLRNLLWLPLYLLLGVTVALFAAAAVYDRWGGATARRALPALLAVGLAFFVATPFLPGGFLGFVVFEAAAMLFALTVYTRLALHRRLEGATWIGVGIALNLLAAGVQATGSVRLTLGVPFDHNGVFHLIQIAAIGVLVVGIRRGFGEATEAGSGDPSGPAAVRVGGPGGGSR